VLASTVLGSKQGRNQLFILGEAIFIHEFSFDDVIVFIQPWYNFSQAVTDNVLFATLPIMRTFKF